MSGSSCNLSGGAHVEAGSPRGAQSSDSSRYLIGGCASVGFTRDDLSRYGGAKAADRAVYCPLGDIPPTGKSATVQMTAMGHIRDGRIVEEWELFDQLGMLQQLGVIPVEANA